MDPISLILTALAAGAAAALKDTAGQAVKDAYSGLKALLKRKLGEEPIAQEVIERHEEAPGDLGEAVWRTELEKAGVADDEEVDPARRELMAKHDPARRAEPASTTCTISGGKGIIGRRPRPRRA